AGGRADLDLVDVVDLDQGRQQAQAAGLDLHPHRAGGAGRDGDLVVVEVGDRGDVEVGDQGGQVTDQAGDVGGRGEAAVGGGGVRAAGQAGAVDRPDAADVVGPQARLDAVVRGVHDGGGDRAVVQAQGVAYLVGGDGEQVVAAGLVDPPRLRRVEGEVAAGG